MENAGYFTTDTDDFLTDLKANNDRGWFQANKQRYEDHVQGPALRFVSDFAPHLQALSPHFHAGPRSLFRIHRDTRFSPDKSPYKTYTGIQFRHDRGKDAHAPGYYVHIEPGEAFAALGLWQPDPAALAKIRERIVERPEAWTSAARAPDFAATFEIEGETLKRPPRGFDPGHPLIEDLKRKSFIAVRKLDSAALSSAGLPAELGGLFATGNPYMRFLCEALDVPF